MITPVKKLTVKRVSCLAGRNQTGQIVTFHRGGRVARRYRLIDFTRRLWNVPGIVIRIEKDPFRSAPIALILYRNGISAYILQPHGVQIGHMLENGLMCELSVGSAMPLRYIPLGTTVHAVENNFGSGASFIRSAGTFGKILNKNLNYTLLRLCSGEERFILASCVAIIGRIAGINHKEKDLFTAGRARRLGWLPRNRPSARNPVDHPLGGRTKGGKVPVSASGWPQGAKRRIVSNKYVFKTRNG